MQFQSKSPVCFKGTGKADPKMYVKEKSKSILKTKLGGGGASLTYGLSLKNKGIIIKTVCYLMQTQV